jgi:hypothetical protein
MQPTLKVFWHQQHRQPVCTSRIASLQSVITPE